MAATLHGLLLFIALDIAFRFWGFQRVFNWMTRPASPRSHRSGPVSAARVFAAVQTANRYYYRRRRDCLPRALVTFYLLRRNAVPATLVFGVRKFPFGGHTWVEAEGEVLDDRPERIARYTPIRRVA